jgi:hypothetical protein
LSQVPIGNNETGKTHLVFLPYRWWITMAIFVAVEAVSQIVDHRNYPGLIAMFFLFLLVIAVRDTDRSGWHRAIWAVGIYAVWFTVPLLVVITLSKMGVNSLPMAALLISLGQCPALWLAMRRSTFYVRQLR